jgi:hypothetical protein
MEITYVNQKKITLVEYTIFQRCYRQLVVSSLAPDDNDETIRTSHPLIIYTQKTNNKHKNRRNHERIIKTSNNTY